MASTLTFFSQRRLINLGLLLSAVAAFWALQESYANGIRSTGLLSGTALFGTCLLLALFNARKKLPFIPLLKASTWTQFHIYAGWFAVVVFFFHTGLRMPNGLFEIALYSVFLAVALSGVLGLIISRIYPSRLRLYGENLMYERIPSLRQQLQADVEKIIWKSVNETKSFTLARMYEAKLKAYFSAKQNTLLHLIGSEEAVNDLTEELNQLQRYMVASERVFLAEVIECVKAKDNLDMQATCQGVLKYWLFIHIPLTFSLLLMGLLHGLMALAFN
jgi:hypothetical protein